MWLLFLPAILILSPVQYHSSEIACRDRTFGVMDNENACYEFHSQLVSYDDATSHCLSIGGSLAGINKNNSVKISDAIKKALRGKELELPIWTYNFWDKQIVLNLLPNKNPIVIDTQINKAAFLCEFDKVNPCDEGWRHKDGYCFQEITKDGIWSTYKDQRKICQDMGGDLASIISRGEMDVVQDVVTRNKSTEHGQPNTLVRVLFFGIQYNAENRKYSWLDKRTYRFPVEWYNVSNAQTQSVSYPWEYLFQLENDACRMIIQGFPDKWLWRCSEGSQSVPDSAPGAVCDKRAIVHQK